MMDSQDSSRSSDQGRRALLRRAGAAYLLFQGLGGFAWWLVLLLRPETRPLFTATDAPESSLLAFAGADLLFYVGGSLASAYGLWRSRSWAWPMLCVHAGAAAYAACYTLGLWCLERQAWRPAVLMLPSLVVPLWLAWQVRPRGKLPC